VAYNCVVLVYLPRSLRLVLPLIGCSASSYLGAFIAPAISTFVGVVLFLVLVHYSVLGMWIQVGSAGLIEVLGIAVSTLVQRRVLLRELREIQFMQS
jgi:hypothetical protein